MNVTARLTAEDLAALFPTPNFDAYWLLVLTELQDVFNEGAIHICLTRTGQDGVVNPLLTHAHNKDMEPLEIQCRPRFLEYMTMLAYHYVPNFTVGDGGGITIILHSEDGCFQLGISGWYTARNEEFSYHS